jgi:molybdenum cofactor cytidylyltransferase/nicotine blue oxidoreductase
MGRPKAELVVAGERLVDRAVRVLAQGGCDPVLAIVRDGVAAPGARIVVNPDPGRGMRSSLDLAVSATGDADALAVLLVDVPGVTAEAVRTVLAGWRAGRIAVGSYGDRRGHPIVAAPEVWRAALALAGPDEGARALLGTCPDLVDEIEVAGDPTDLDTPEDLARWTGR